MGWISKGARARITAAMASGRASGFIPLIEKVLYHLDWDDILKLFEIYPKNRIKEVWKNKLCPLGNYFDKMNILYAAVLFDIKNPKKYIKTQSNRYLKNKINVGQRIIASHGINI